MKSETSKVLSILQANGYSEIDAFNAIIAAGDDIADGRDIQPGEIVQLDPISTGNKAFAACMMVVTEVKPWGVQGYVQGLGTREAQVGQAYYRAETDTFARTFGRAPWRIQEETT